MLDLETMSLRPNAAIVSIGAAFFSEDAVGDTFHSAVSLKSCIEAGLHFDEKTKAWWDLQSSEARASWDLENPPTLQDALQGFSAFVRSYGSEVRVWANGADFDIPILKSCFEAFDADPPWKYYNQRCFRTVRGLFGQGIEVARIGTYHNARDDSIYQVHVLQAICKQMGFALA